MIPGTAEASRTEIPATRGDGDGDGDGDGEQETSVVLGRAQGSLSRLWALAGVERR